MDKIKEFKRLQKENEEMRKNISKIVGKNKKLWIMINELIENELEQEELCE